MRVRVKFCGITRLQDALAAVELGVDALGFIFWPQSPRHIAMDSAKRIIAALPPFVSTVGLFVDQEAADVLRIARECAIDVLQFHGDEPAAFCDAMGKELGMRYIKAIPMHPDIDVASRFQDYEGAAAFLLDTYKPGVVGGTGESFAWTRVPRHLLKPIVLAGGLGIENVADAIRRVQPYAVDVNSGIEAGKGIKDQDRMQRIMQEIRRVA